MSQSRQLAAIMFTDIVGYTLLMGYDEQKAFDLLNSNRELQKPIIEQFNGKWIKELGDGIMASFNTVSDAVHAAIEMQKACNAANHYQLRIGIHLGEVVFENEDVFGDGVNIASRIQAIANPGSIYVSESVYHNISNKPGIETRYVKQETLKHVKEPVRIYEVLGHSIQQKALSGEINPSGLAAIPVKSIAVLPFINMSQDPEQEYFSDGLTEEIIANLSRLKDIRVISRTTSMLYKGTKKDIQTIGRELRVMYILEGSVRKSQDNLRITAQFIDIGNDANLWAEMYKGKLEDVFDIQEQVSKQIIDALKVQLAPNETAIVNNRTTHNVEAFDYYLRARDFLNRRTKNNILFAIQLFRNALELDPGYAAAYAGLGEAFATYYQVCERNQLWLEKSIESSLKSLLYDAASSDAYAALGLAYYNQGKIDESSVATQKAIELDPNNFIGFWIMGRIYHTTDRDREAVQLFKKVITLYPDFYVAYNDLLIVYERLGEKEKYDQILDHNLGEIYPRYLSKHPDDARAHMTYGVTLNLKGRKQEALAEAAKALALSPDDPMIMYNGACFYSRIRENELALKMFKNAVRLGFEHFEWFKRDPDLDNIRNEPEYIDLMKGK